MNFADQKMVRKLRKEFPVGCRIVLDKMDDGQAPPIGTQGTCNGVDDAGNVLVSWDTGSHLNVAYGADSCHRVASEAEVKVVTRPPWENAADRPTLPQVRSKARLLRPSAAGTQPKGGHPDLQPLWNGGSVRGHCMGRTSESAFGRLGDRESGVGRMKVLLVKPMEHPQVVDLENSLEEFYRILDCDCITATYPWEECAALVTDDNGLFTEKPFSRYIPELEQPIKGNFFICGLGEEDFAELPEDLIRKFTKQFWVPEAFVSMFGQMAVIQMDDGTKPE